jgi:hypothetical protein
MACLLVVSITVALIPQSFALAHNQGEETSGTPVLCSDAKFYNSRRLQPDIEQMVPLDDPKVLQAGEVIRNETNSQRLKNCAHMMLFDQVGIIQSAKKGIELNGTVLYTIEVSFGNSTIFARISIFFDARQSANLHFEIKTIIPGPCENELQNQLAVSSQGEIYASRVFLWFMVQISSELTTYEPLRMRIGSGRVHKQPKPLMDRHSEPRK